MEDGYDAVNMARALDLAAGRELETLPPEAFELSRDRSNAAPSLEDPALDAAGTRA
jgi:hypothetical protein